MGRGQRTEDREEGLEKQIKRNGADTGRCEEDGEEGGRLEKNRGEDREQRIRNRNGADTVRCEGGRIREADNEEWGRYNKV